MSNTPTPTGGRWKSCAEWAPEVYSDRITTDTHDTKEQALAVCGKLQQEGFTGERKEFPIRTWTEHVPETDFGNITPTGGQVESAQLGECNVRQREDLLAENAALREEVERLKMSLGASLQNFKQCIAASEDVPADDCFQPIPALVIREQRAELARLRDARDECERQFQAKVQEIGGLLSELSTLRATNAWLVEATGALLQYAEIHECQHEETHRGGAIWTICDRCGRKWADDTGGFQPYQEPPQFEAARAALDAAKGGEA